MTPPDRTQNLDMALEAVLRDLRAAEAELSAVTFRVHHAREAAASLQALVGVARASQIAEEVGVRLPQRRPQAAGLSNNEVLRRAAIERRRAAAELEAEHVRRAEHIAGAEPRRAAEQEAQVASSSDGDSVAESKLRRMVGAGQDTESPVKAGASPRADGDVSSTDRVIQLLKEYEGKAIPRAMILEEFKKRGWVDPSWGHPNPAIRMAIRRATEKGAAQVVGDGRYTYADPGLLGDLASGGDA